MHGFPLVISQKYGVGVCTISFVVAVAVFVINLVSSSFSITPVKFVVWSTESHECADVPHRKIAFEVDK